LEYAAATVTSRFAGVSRAAAVALAIALWLGEPSARSQSTAGEPLTVDFYALGADGAAAPNLTTAEIAIKIDGRTRTVQSLRLIKQGNAPSGDPMALTTVLPPPFGTNNVAEFGRSFVVMIDDESFRPGRERAIHTAVDAFIRSLSPTDRVSLWTMPHGGMKVDLTRDHDRIRQAVQVVVGRGVNRESGPDMACRTRTSLEVIDGVLTGMAGGEGPTLVMVVTSSMVGPRRDNAPNMPPGPCELPVEHFARVGRDAASARAHFFVVQPEDLVRDGTAPATNENPLEGIEHLTGVTGGTLVPLARLGEDGLAMVSRATTSYYSAVIAGSATDTEGSHILAVDVSRAGVKVRSRPTLLIRKPSDVKSRARTPAEMIRVSDAFTALQMRASGVSTLNGADGTMRIVAAAEPVEPGVTFKALSAALFDSRGRLAAQSHVADADLQSTPAMAALIVPSGTYRLRVAGVDANGRAGAVDVNIDAQLVSSGSLKLSSLVLGVSRSGGFQPRLQFTNEISAIGYLEIFGAAPGARVAAFLEVAASPDAAPILRTPLTIEATSDPSRFRAQGAIPMGALPPGDYVARALVGLEGQSLGQVLKAFRKAG